MPMLADLDSRMSDISPKSSAYKPQKPLKVLLEERSDYWICLEFVSKAADSPQKPNIVDKAALAIAKTPHALRDLQRGPWMLPPRLFLSEFGIERLISKSFAKYLLRLSNEEPDFFTALQKLRQTATERRKGPRKKSSIQWKPSDITKTIVDIRSHRSRCR